jgi:hypothetical protein
MNYAVVIAILVVPVVLAIVIGSILLKKALTKPVILPEEIALPVAWFFIVGSLVWLGVFLSESTLLGFGAPELKKGSLHYLCGRRILGIQIFSKHMPLDDVEKMNF